MPRKSAKPIIAFFGSGEFDAKEITATLDDRIGEDDVVIMLPTTRQHWTDTYKTIAEWALGYEFTVRCVSDDESQNARVLKPVLNGADKVDIVSTKSVPTKMVSILKSAPDGSYLVGIFPADGEPDDDELEGLWPKAVEDEAPAKSKKSDDEEDESEAEADDEEFTPYTEDELDEMDLAELKKIAVEDFSLELTPRARKPRVIEQILAAQEEEADDSDDSTEETKAPASAETVSFDVEEFVERLMAGLGSGLTAALLGALSESITGAKDEVLEEVQSLRTKVDELIAAVDSIGTPAAKAEAPAAAKESNGPVRRRRRPR